MYEIGTENRRETPLPPVHTVLILSNKLQEKIKGFLLFLQTACNVYKFTDLLLLNF